MNLMDSVRHELEHSSFFSIFHSCIHVYSKKSPPDFKRKNDTYRIAPAIPVDSVTILSPPDFKR